MRPCLTLLGTRLPVLALAGRPAQQTTNGPLLLQQSWTYILCKALGGDVVKVGVDFLGLHVLGIFNAAIGREQIRTDLVYRAQVSSAA